MSAPADRFRRAVVSDLPAIVRMLADDELGARRERLEEPLPASYFSAFEAIARDPNNELVVAEGEDGSVVAVLQLTFTPYITRQGGWRATIEGVRVERRLRGSGLGRQLLAWAIERAKQRGCHLVQLTTDKQRHAAKGFYESLGFTASHEGMKLELTVKPETAGALLHPAH
jgi:ribosomal protein S18 acetylase RimI-like enzyme